MSDSLPLNEISEYRRSTSNHWIVLGLLVIAHAGLVAYFSSARLRDNYPSYPLIVGVIFSQPLILAFWTAFAPQRFYHRFLWGLLLCAFLSSVAEVGTLFQEIRQLGFFLSMDLILFFVATPCLLLVRRFSRWKLAQSAAEPIISDYQTNQFGIKHLFVLTTVTALVCGLFRTLTVIDPSLSPAPVAEVVKIVFQIASLFLPMALIPWLTLGYHKNMPVSVFCAIAVLGISDAACYFLFRNEPGPDVLQIILLVQLGAGLSVVISTLVIRWCGFRMIRQPRIQAQG